jgi:glutathione synthase
MPGGRAIKTHVTSVEKKLVAELAPHLAQLGLDFVGLDLIGNQLIEINATSPMGLNELNHTDQRRSEREVLDFLEQKILNFSSRTAS